MQERRHSSYYRHDFATISSSRIRQKNTDCFTCKKQYWIPTFNADFYYLSNRGDRKSTRLNSSHVSISYAVFCLKKKRKTEMRCTKESKRSVGETYTVS